MEGRTDKTDGRPPFDCPPTQVTSKVPYLSPRIREFLPLCTCKFTPETSHRPHHHPREGGPEWLIWGWGGPYG